MFKTELKEGTYPLRLPSGQRIGYAVRFIYDDLQLIKGTTTDEVINFIVDEFKIVAEFKKVHKIFTVLTIRKDNQWVFIVDIVKHLFPPFDRILEGKEVQY